MEAARQMALVTRAVRLVDRQLSAVRPDTRFPGAKGDNRAGRSTRYQQRPASFMRAAAPLRGPSVSSGTTAATLSILQQFLNSGIVGSEPPGLGEGFDCFFITPLFEQQDAQVLMRRRVVLSDFDR